jgi:hypothetical protein
VQAELEARMAAMEAEVEYQKEDNLLHQGMQEDAKQLTQRMYEHTMALSKEIRIPTHNVEH